MQGSSVHGKGIGRSGGHCDAMIRGNWLVLIKHVKSVRCRRGRAIGCDADEDSLAGW